VSSLAQSPWPLRSNGRADAPGFAYAAEFLDVDQVSKVQAEWRSLLNDAREPNPFLGPDFFLPLIEKIAGDRLSGAMVLRRREMSGSSRLAAFFPYRIASRFPLTSLPVVEAFTHPFVSDGTPLLQGEGVEGAAAAFFAALESRFRGHMLVLDWLRLETPTAAALESAAALRGLPFLLVRSHERAALRADLPSERYLRERVGGKKLRELRRCEKRLHEQGQVEMRTLSGCDVAAGLREFLRLEASGWKGKRGSALASIPQTRDFAEAALVGGDAPATAIDILRVGGVAIAAAVHLVAGGNAVAFLRRKLGTHVAGGLARPPHPTARARRKAIPSDGFGRRSGPPRRGSSQPSMSSSSSMRPS
jgi:Acetyltransferase (GNAT) domain